MELLPPRFIGPLSECSRSVVFENAFPGATVILLRTRNGVTQEVGKTTPLVSIGLVPVNPGEDLAAGDLVTGFQFTNAEASPWQPDVLEVQKSEAPFNAPQILSHLYQCSRGFTVGALRPGARVEVLDGGGSLIATGESTNGVAHLRVVNAYGLPMPGAQLTVRQRICPKPPPPGGAPEWVIDSALPPVEPLPIKVVAFDLVPPPTIVSGLTACSRSIELADVIPGAEIVIEDSDGAWWATGSPSDLTTRSVPLPVELAEGREVRVRQEIGQACEMEGHRFRATVGPRQPLPKPSLFQIDCHSSPTLNISALKPEADVEIEVVFQGQTRLFRGKATNAGGPFPAPPMPAGAVVRVRQGECQHWSDWSDPRIAMALNRPVSKPRIVGALFQCQNRIYIENLDPIASGTLRVVSNALGVIGQTADFGSETSIPVAPALTAGHEIVVIHQVCGVTVASDPKQVHPLPKDPGIGEMVQPLYDGDTSVAVENVTDGAYLEIWDQDHRLHSGYAPSSLNGKSTVTFSGLKALHAGQHIHARFWHCGHYGRNLGAPVFYRKPELHQVNPNTVALGLIDVALKLVGAHFRPGVLVNAGSGGLNTTFLSTSQLDCVIPNYMVNTPGVRKVQVQNPDGQWSNVVEIQIIEQPAPSPPPPEPPAPTPQPAYGSVLLSNCSYDKADLYIYQRDVTLGQPFQLVQIMEHQYNDLGLCPADSEPLEIELTDGHYTEIVIVDPGRIGCIPQGDDPSTASPMTLACRKGVLLVLGKASAPPLKEVIW